MQIGDLVKTIYRDEYAIVTKVWYAEAVKSLAVQFVYPSDLYQGSQPMGYIKEVVNASR